MRMVDIITKKRGMKGSRGTALSREEIAFVVNGYVAGEIPEYQISAWLMAIFFNGMTFEETALLTDTMLKSGKMMDLSGLSGPFVDKHSTGGVGDKISIPLAPIVAACGVNVPMMSGRALGHTGGTLDKLESVTGYRTDLTAESFKNIIMQNGYAMTGQTKEIVPADRLLYALRDVTGTVESIPLITASILSKKVAEGADALVFDVKCGSGAFMKTHEDAEALAKSLVGTGTAMGKKVVALITDMDEPLGNAMGNFLEMEESYRLLCGEAPEDITELTLQCAAWMLVLGSKAQTKQEGLEKARAAVTSGAAKERFLENIRLQGGNAAQFEAECGTRRSAYSCNITAAQDGFIAGIDAYSTGIAGVHLGVGRNKTTDPVAPDAGILFEKRRGDAVKKGDVIMHLYGKDTASLEAASALLNGAVRYDSTPPEKKPMVLQEITSDSIS